MYFVNKYYKKALVWGIMENIHYAIRNHDNLVKNVQDILDQRLKEMDKRTTISTLTFGLIALALGVAGSPLALPICGVGMVKLLSSRGYKGLYQENTEIINRPTLVEIVDGNLTIGFEQKIVENSPKKRGKIILKREEAHLCYNQKLEHFKSELTKTINICDYQNRNLRWNYNFLTTEIDDLKNESANPSRRSKLEALRTDALMRAKRNMGYVEYLENELKVACTIRSRYGVVSEAVKVGGKILREYTPQEGLEETVALHQKLENLYGQIVILSEASYPLMQEKTKLLLAPLNSS